METSIFSLSSSSLLNVLVHSDYIESTTLDISWEIVLKSPVSKVIESWLLMVLLQTPNH